VLFKGKRKKGMKPKLGQWYKVSHELIRVKEGFQRFWYSSKNKQKAMLIGIRNITDGTVSESSFDGAIFYKPYSHFKAYMLVSDIREQPFFALPEHCEFMSNWQVID